MNSCNENATTFLAADVRSGVFSFTTIYHDKLSCSIKFMTQNLFHRSEKWQKKPGRNLGNALERRGLSSIYIELLQSFTLDVNRIDIFGFGDQTIFQKRAKLVDVFLR